jgi:hypothetical protein
MFYVLQNESDGNLRRVPILLTDAATGTTAQTGVATTNIHPYVNINGGAFAGGAGTVGEAGYGQYYYQMDSTEIGTLGLAGIHITATGCRDYDAIAQIAAFNLYAAASGATAGEIATAVWDYPSSPANPSTTLEYLAETRTEAFSASNNTNNISDQVWNTDVSSFTSPSAGYDLTQAAVGSGLTAGDVWDFSITGFGGTNSAAVYVTDTYFTVGNIETYVSTQTPQDVWTYAGIEGRTITGGIADTVTSVTNGVIVTTNNDKTGYALSSTQTFDLTGNISGSVGSVTADVNVSTASMAGVANTVWSTLTAPYTTHATFGHQVLRSDNAATIGEVTLHQSGGSKRVDADVHAFVNNTAAATAMLNILTGIGSSMTTNITGSISGSVGSVTSAVNVSTASMTGIANTTWSTDVSAYTSPSAGYDLANASAGGGITAGDVWSYATRTITGGIADTVTSVTNGVTVTTNNDKTGYALSGTQSFNLTGNITGNLSGSVGSVSGNVGGNVTGSVGSVVGAVGSVTSPVSVATASMTGIAGTVWSVATRTITGGTITTVSDKTGYSLSGTQSFNLTGNITGSLSGSVGSVTGSVGSVVSAVTLSAGTQASIANSVWSTNISGYGAGTAGNVLNAAGGGGIALTAGDIWTYNSRTLTSAAGITAGDVWSYVLSNTDTAGTNLVNAAAGGNGITAGDVWTYDIGGITASGSAGNALNDAAVSGSVVTIVNGPYKLNSTAEGTDGRIDILQGSVQTINLNLVNGFGQPFNVTGYSLSVDVYDVSSSLVESYVPTVNFASGGNISFDIDGTVTDVIGTYTLVVSLTDGDVIQVGPITILVRPL